MHITDTHSPSPVADIPPGFDNPVLESQAVFRAVLQSMALPGTISPLKSAPRAPAPMSSASAAVCLALVDIDTPLWLSPSASGGAELETYLKFHCGCPITRNKQNAAVALILDGRRLPDLGAFNQGEQEYPDRSCTMVIQVDDLQQSDTPVPGGVRLSGPGIPGDTFLRVDGLSSRFWPQFLANHHCFPLGFDVIFTALCGVACLPRTTKYLGEV